MPKIVKGNLKWYGVVSLALLLLVSLLIIGCQGPPGERGPAGTPGEKGAAGASGPAGSAGPAGTSVGTIEGKVTALATGKGVEKATVVTVPAVASATADAEGKYKIDNVPAGVYTVKASATGYKATSAKVSVTAGKTVTTSLSLKAGEPFALAKVKGVGYRMNSPDTYPDGKLRLTTHYALESQPLTRGENLIQTSGLPNVGVGSYVYLEGRESDAKEKTIKSWAWQVVGPGESTVTMENATSRTPRFKADKVGKYEVTVTATNDAGEKSSSELVAYAGTYVGVQTCAACHSGSLKPDTVSEWQQTGHATKLVVAYPSYTATRDYCIACHTTGYDERDKAGGFDDLAQQAGWDPAKKSLTGWLTDNKWTVDQITTAAMGKLANVQCESCHGPGLIHEGIKLAKETGALYQPSSCSQCHPQEVNWRYSGHANTGAVEMHMAEGTSCVECHTGQGFIEVKIRGKSPIFPKMATAEEPATLAEPSQQPPVACATCHDPHAFTEPFNKGTAAAPNIASYQLRLSGKVTMPSGVTVDAKESALCVSCHANKRDLAYKADYSAGKKTRGAHDNTQADVFYGVSEAVFDFGGGKYGSSPHAAIVTEGCIQCHMAASPKVGGITVPSVGGHSWSMEGTYQGQEVQNVAVCTGCHAGLTIFNRPAFGDYDGNGKVEGVKDEVVGLLKLLEAQLPKDPTGAVLSYPIAADKTTELQRQALWNYWVIAKDGSKGRHNTAFAVQVLQRTYKALTGKDVPGATPR